MSAFPRIPLPGARVTISGQDLPARRAQLEAHRGELLSCGDNVVVSDRVCVQCVGLGLVICPSVVSLTSAVCFLPRSAADPRRRIELLEAVLCTCIYLFMLRVYGRLAVMCPPGEIVNWQTDRIVFIPHRLIIFNQMCWVCFASSFLHEGICCLINSFLYFYLHLSGQ